MPKDWSLDPLTVQKLVAHGMEWAIMTLPLAVHLLNLGLGVNRRRHPVPIRGDRDFYRMLAALSGFLLLGPASWLVFPFHALGNKFYWIVYAVYLVGLFWTAYVLGRRQRRDWHIYNINPLAFAEMLPKLLAELDVPHVVTPGRVAFADGRLVLDIESSQMLHNVSLRWTGEDALVRGNIETKLLAALADLETGEHSGGLLLTFAGIIMCSFILFAAVLFGVLMLTLHWLP